MTAVAVVIVLLWLFTVALAVANLNRANNQKRDLPLTYICWAFSLTASIPTWYLLAVIFLLDNVGELTLSFGKNIIFISIACVSPLLLSVWALIVDLKNISKKNRSNPDIIDDLGD